MTNMHKSLVSLVAAGGICSLAWLASDVPVAHAQLVRAHPMTGEALLIPVVGIDREQLRDTFAEARSGHVHEAIDILAPRGTPVVAVVDGTVQKLYRSRLGGLTIYEFDETSTRSYYYAHLDRYAQGIAEGKRVRRGEVIGYVGQTGNAQTPHLHFGIAVLPPTREWWKGQPVNPYQELMARGVVTSAAAE